MDIFILNTKQLRRKNPEENIDYYSATCYIYTLYPFCGSYQQLPYKLLGWVTHIQVGTKKFFYNNL